MSRPSLAERFWPKVERREPDECWPWKASVTGRGYGRFALSGKARHAHRVSYEIANGQAPGDLFVLHRCDNPPCVNPAHLFLGTNTDNVRDAVAKGRHSNTRKTHCIHGHEFTPKNTRYSKTGKRGCRMCARLSQRRIVARRRGQSA